MSISKLILVLFATPAVLFLVAWSIDSFGFRSPAAALLVNWLAMAWMAIAGQAIHFQLSPGYYAHRPFEQAGRIYERLGIRVFKQLLRRGPLAVLSPTLKFPAEKTMAAYARLVGEMRQAEAAHLVIFIVMIVPAVYALLNEWGDAFGWMLLFNILLNGYPVMLQRYNRITLQERLEREGLLAVRERPSSSMGDSSHARGAARTEAQ